MIVELEAQEIPIRPEAVYRGMGYPSADKASAKIRAELPDFIKKVKDRARPLAVAESAILVAGIHRSLQIEGGPKFHGGLLYRALGQVRTAGLFALTAGREVCDWAAAVGREDIWAGMVLDVIASELVESAADLLESQLAERLGVSEKLRTLRYSPGYCDWPIDELPPLLKAIDARSIGIELTAGGMMTPQKSIAGIVGFTDDQQAAGFIPCRLCPKECDYRRVEFNSSGG